MWWNENENARLRTIGRTPSTHFQIHVACFALLLRIVLSEQPITLSHIHTHTDAISIWIDSEMWVDERWGEKCPLTCPREPFVYEYSMRTLRSPSNNTFRATNKQTTINYLDGRVLVRYSRMQLPHLARRITCFSSYGDLHSVVSALSTQYRARKDMENVCLPN